VALLHLSGSDTAATLVLLVVLWCYVGPVPPRGPLINWLNRNLSHAFREESMLVEGGELDRSAPFLLAFHPHGMFSWGYFGHGGMHLALNPSDEVLPPTAVTGLITDVLVMQPLWRFVFIRWLRVLDSASKPAFLRLMRARKNIGLLPGGFHEASISELGKDRVYLKKRFGFIKYALQFGYGVYPIYTFGESDTYYNPSGGYWWRLKLNDHDVPAIFPIGKWWCPLLPRHDVGLHTVVGKKLVLPKIEEPTPEDVAKWHAVYVGELKALFDRHKATCSARGAAAELEIW